MKVCRFSRTLEAPQPPVIWPPGFMLVPFTPEASAKILHRLLADCYANGGGRVPDYLTWWDLLASDADYDPELVFTVFGPTGRLAGVAVCWTTAYVKDLAVAQPHRRLGLASALLRHVFATFQLREATSVDLKVEADNSAAISLYRSVGMKECDN